MPEFGPGSGSSVPGAGLPRRSASDRLRRLAGVLAIVGACALFYQQVTRHFLQPWQMGRRGIAVDAVFRASRQPDPATEPGESILVFQFLDADRPKIPRLRGDSVEIRWFGPPPAGWEAGQQQVRLLVDPVLGADQVIVDPAVARPRMRPQDRNSLTSGMLLLLGGLLMVLSPWRRR